MSPRNTQMSIYTEPAIFDGHAKGANFALQNPVVARCCQAWQHAYQEYAECDESEIGARGWACKAYRNAMPVLAGEEDLNDFIACLTHGLLIGAIPENRASKLLYAVQVTLAMFRRAHKINEAEEEKTDTPPPPSQDSTTSGKCENSSITRSRSQDDNQQKTNSMHSKHVRCHPRKFQPKGEHNAKNLAPKPDPNCTRNSAPRALLDGSEALGSEGATEHEGQATRDQGNKRRGAGWRLQKKFPLHDFSRRGNVFCSKRLSRTGEDDPVSYQLAGPWQLSTPLSL